MAKGYDKGRSRVVGMQGYVPGPDAVLAKKLGEIVSDLYLATSEDDVKRLWTSAHRLLLTSKADPQRVEAIVKAKRIGALSTLAQELDAASKPSLRRSGAGTEPVVAGLETASAAQPAAPEVRASVSPQAAPSASQQPSSEQLKHAMKAFRKRLKLTRLDDESRLGSRAMTGGRKSSVVAIMPPREYPQAVWDELVRQGRIKPAGNGFYELVGE